MAREVGGWDEVARRRAEAALRTSPEARSLQLELLRLAGDVGGLRVLLLACGTGALARRLAERGARVLALDPSADAIERALEEARELEVQGRLEFAVADAGERASRAASRRRRCGASPIRDRSAGRPRRRRWP